MKREISSRISELKARIVQVHSQHQGSPRSVRFPNEIKNEVYELFLTSGLSQPELAKHLELSLQRVREWCLKVKSQADAPSLKEGFKELKVLSRKQTNSTTPSHEARIVTASGLSIFIPLECLTLSFIANLEEV